MSKTFAYIQQGIIQEIIPGTVTLDGVEYDITERFTPEFLESCVEITDQDPMPDWGWTATNNGGAWVFAPYVAPPIAPEILAANARAQRENLLRTVYDAGILMAQRAVRLAQTPEEEAYAEGKIAELDAYAEALLAIPDQPGFPQTITWPVAPTK